jgi:hypothetical protein
MSDEPSVSDPQSIVDETRKFWRPTAQDAVKGSAQSIDETAKQIIAVVGILEGLYFHAIAFSSVKGTISTVLEVLAYLAPLIFWLFSLIAASLVFLPRTYQININSSEAAKRLYEDVVRRKYFFLIFSLAWMVIGSMFLIVALVVYLS